MNRAEEVQNNSHDLEENFQLNSGPQNSQTSQQDENQVSKQEVSIVLETNTSNRSVDILVTQRVSRHVSERFLVSFGSWNTISSILGQLEFFRLQALCKYMYQTCISRSQPRLQIFTSDFFAMTCGFLADFQNSIILCKKGQREEKWTLFRDDRINLWSKQTIFVRNNLFVFGRDGPSI